jgi:hypothetical protein
MAETITIRTGAATEVITVIEAGPQGPQGQGVPVGGTTGQVLRKVSGTNYDTEWAAAAAGSGSVTSVALAGSGLSISGSPITTSGTITANVSYGTTAGTACQGNDSRIANIAANSINTTDSGGSINTSDSGGSINTSDQGGSIITGPRGGSINTSGSSGFPGGSINLVSDANALAGSINMSSSNTNEGGSINTYGAGSAGGSIDTWGGGGSINTRGTGSIGLGVSGTRTTLTGTATADRAISLPNRGGTVVVSDTSAGSGSDVVNNIVSLTQAEYNAIGSPDAATLFLITDP